MVLPTNAQSALAVSFALVFTSSTLAAVRSTLRPLPDASVDEGHATSTTASLHLESPPEGATWCLLLAIFIFVPALGVYAYTRSRVCPEPHAPATWRPCQTQQQAYVAATLFAFAALAGPIVFAFAWAQQLGIRLAAAAYGVLAAPSLLIYLAAGTSFPALIRRLPSDPYYAVED